MRKISSLGNVFALSFSVNPHFVYLQLQWLIRQIRAELQGTSDVLKIRRESLST